MLVDSPGRLRHPKYILLGCCRAKSKLRIDLLLDLGWMFRLTLGKVPEPYERPPNTEAMDFPTVSIGPPNYNNDLVLISWRNTRFYIPAFV